VEKVKLTQEQADAINNLMEKRTKDSIVRERANPFSQAGAYVGKSNDIVFKEMDFDTLIKALYIGYEVEPDFKVGDWVITRAFGKSHKNRALKIRKTNKNYTTGKSYYYFENTDEPHYNCYLEDIDRHATPEEIAKEKQRIWWAKHDRGVWELREGVALKAVDGGCLVEVCEVFDSHNVGLTGVIPHVKISELKEGYKVVYFAEDRKDLGDD